MDRKQEGKDTEEKKVMNAVDSGYQKGNTDKIGRIEEKSLITTKRI